MKRLFGALAVAGLMVTAGMAQAATVVDLNVTKSLTPPADIASGSYHVVISNVGGSNYQVTVQGNPDGLVPPPGPGNTPKSGVGTVGIDFFDVSMAHIGSVTGAGSNTAYSGPPGGNVGGPASIAYGGLPGVWSVADPSSLTWGAPTTDNWVAPHGGNAFTGNFTLASGNIGLVQISLQDGVQQWTKQVALVPEPGALAMLLPGLAPVGMMLRRRRRASKS
ncbi:MAG TPA: PEP-CTERM sorting domain-containing protein [Armatimonadota bacterium]|jgi:hypothetical protein